MEVRCGVRGDMRKEERIRSDKLLEETRRKYEHDCQPNQSVSLNECFLHTSLVRENYLYSTNHILIKC